MSKSRKTHSCIEKLHIRLWFYKRFIKILIISISNKVVLITGLPRSASTLIFNICRILLKQSGRNYKSYWINDIPFKISFGKVYIIKIHDYDPLIASLPLTFVHSTRDLKEIASSATVKDQIEPSIEQIKNIWYWDVKWRNKANLLLNYHDLFDIKKPIFRLSDLLELEVKSIKTIVEEINSLQEPKDDNYDKISQLNMRHRTGSGLKWQKILSDKLIKEINDLNLRF